MIFVITISVIIIYVVLIAIFATGWSKIPEFEIIKTDDKRINTSLIVACRNEENNIKTLIEKLENQSLKNFEIIFVDDHSSDKTLELLKDSLPLFSEIKVIESNGNGKKHAIAEGIGIAKGDLIITTDADCIPGQEWIETIISFHDKTKADLIICPVKMIEHDSLFSKLQAIEFLSLVASGAGAAGVGMPILCNAANLAFTKKAWLESKNDLKNNEPSGDDVFLLLSIKKRNGKILFIKSQKAVVITQS